MISETFGWYALAAAAGILAGVLIVMVSVRIKLHRVRAALANGGHLYMSVGCLHGKHAECDPSCEQCGNRCCCRECRHSWTKEL
jgi:hypothetical protein